MDDFSPVRVMPGHVMSDEAIDRLLSDLAEVCRQACAAQAEAERLRDELSAANEWDGERAGLRVDPRRALTNERTLLAENVADEHYRIAQRLTAWWVDAAICAAVSVVCGTPLTVARAVAADPSLCMESEELAFLPPIADEDWQLARLAVDMDEALPPGQRPDGWTAVGGYEFAAQVGLSVRRDSAEGPVLVENGVPEARRRRLWGQTWMAYQMPPLPETGGFLEALTGIGAPPAVTAAITQASDAVDAALKARVRAIELENEHSDTDSEEADELWRHYDRLPGLLIGYAHTLTAHLPALRAAR
ncbi:hypothetical protein [Nonomuraea rosea]|uniref:hypothetical protein n=1 Tax=Nonomuraea rosea TaxID=638574 RepID=UPI0031EB6A97